MTEEEKHELAVLADDVERKRKAWEDANGDPIAMTLAQTAWWRAQTVLTRAQARIARMR